MQGFLFLLAFMSFVAIVLYSMYYLKLITSENALAEEEKATQRTKCKLIFFSITFVGSFAALSLLSLDMFYHPQVPVADYKIKYICEEHPNCKTEIDRKNERETIIGDKNKNSTWERDSGIEFAKELDRINTAAQLDAIDDEIRAIKKYRR